MRETISEQQAPELPDFVLTHRLRMARAAVAEGSQLLADALEAELRAWNVKLGPLNQGHVTAQLAEQTSLAARGLLHGAQAQLQTLEKEAVRRNWPARAGGVFDAERAADRDELRDLRNQLRTPHRLQPAEQDQIVRRIAQLQYALERDDVDELPAGDDDGQQADDRGPVPPGRCCWAHVRSGGMYHEGTCTAGARRAARARA